MIDYPTNMNPCPYCGSRMIRVVSNKKKCGTYGLSTPIYRVSSYGHCMNCYARGWLVSGMVTTQIDDGVNSWGTTEKDIVAIAVEKWNRRA